MRYARYAAPFLLAATLLLGALVGSGYTSSFDTGILSAFALKQGSSPDWLIKLAQFISWTGGGTQRYIMVGLFSLILWRWIRWQVGAGLAVGALLSNVISTLLKDAFARPRPSLVPHLDHVNSFSYPSGHATSAMMVYLFVALVVPAAQRSRWMVGMMAMAIATGVSRMMLGVHYPSDVIGGWVLGAAFAIAAAHFVNRKQGVA